MRIVDRKTFLALPPETLFAKYTPCNMGELEIKMDSTGLNDFYATDLKSIDAQSSHEAHALLFDGEAKGENIPIDPFNECRDGLFEESQLFAVWEKSDIERLLVRLTRTAEAYRARTT